MDSEQDTDFKSVQTPITLEFLEKILNRKILRFKTSLGSNPGDNFTTNLISLEIITAHNPENTLHLLYKTLPNHPIRQKFMKDGNIFLKEFQVYDVILNEFSIFQKSVTGDENLLKLAFPKMMAGAAIDYSSEDVKTGKSPDLKLDPILANFIFMVDVRKSGFKMANKLESLGYHHVKKVFEELAKFHAIGYAYKIHNKLPNFRDKFLIFNKRFASSPPKDRSPEQVQMMKPTLKRVLDACNELLESRPEIAESLKKFDDGDLITEYMAALLDPDGMDEEKVEKFIRKVPEIYTDVPPIKEQWIVLAHGDCWTNNILFKENGNGVVTDAVLVDLQVVRESDIMSDLVYFLYTSTDTNFRKQYMNEMLIWYHDRFTNFCGILKVDPFPGFNLENFRRKFHRSKMLGFLFAAMVLPTILQKTETSVNLDMVKSDPKMDGGDGNETNDFIAAVFNQIGRNEDDQKLLQVRMTNLLEELYEEGIL